MTSLRPFFIILCAAALVTLTFADTRAASTNTALSTTAAPLNRRALLPPPFARGTLAKLDLTAKTLTLATPEGDRTFLFTPTTYIFRGKQKISADQLQSGELVHLTYFTNDAHQVTIRRIKVDPLPAAAAAPNPTATKPTAP